MPSVAGILQFLDDFAPLRLAADWDNVGLLLGDAEAPVQQVMTCLTITPESAAEAVDAGANLIVTHHPILFRGVKRLTTATPEERMLLALIQAGVAVYSPHTAFDNTKGGINEALAERLQLKEVTALRAGKGSSQFKVVVFVPDSDLSAVSDAMFAAGAGHIGQYSECSFRQLGSGTFFGSETANPTIGQKGRRENVSEWRVETICPAPHLQAVLAALRQAHSYEEPAYDVYPLHTSPSGAGEGRIGRLSRPTPLSEFAQIAKTQLRAERVLVVGDTSRLVERVAIVCGAGGEFLSDTFRAGVDVFLTGELRFHDYLTAQSNGLALVLPGHYATERFGVEELAERLHKQWPDLVVWASRRERDPVQHV